MYVRDGSKDLAKKKNRTHSRQKDKRKAFGAHLAKQR